MTVVKDMLLKSMLLETTSLYIRRILLNFSPPIQKGLDLAMDCYSSLYFVASRSGILPALELGEGACGWPGE